MSISKIERKELNSLIREILVLRDKKCLRCGTTEKLQGSHIWPKGHYRKLEFDSDNIIFLCYRCHFYFWHKSPLAAAEWIKTVIPLERYNRLKLRAYVTGEGSRDYKLIKLVLQDELNKLKQMT